MAAIRSLLRLSSLVVPVTLVACGGGGGGSPPEDGGNQPPSLMGGGSEADTDMENGGGMETDVPPEMVGPDESFDGPNFTFVVEQDVAAITTDRWQSYFTRQMEAALQPLNDLTGLVDETIQVNYALCGQANAFYNPTTREVTICDELVDDQLVYWSRTSTAIDSTVFVLYHEIGHALDDVRDIPISGNTESAADSIAVVLATETDRGIAAVFGGDFLSSSPSSYGDEHTNGEDRAGDIICWAIGGTTRLAFNSALATFTNQYIEANRDCVEEYAGQRSSIFASVPEIESIVPPALTRPEDITPDDTDPPKDVPGSGSGGIPAGSALDALQNETDATIGRDLWICSASGRSFQLAYLFVGDRGLYVALTGAEELEPFDFSVVAASADAVRLEYAEIGEIENISDIRFTGTTGFTGQSDTEGTLSCARTLLPESSGENDPDPSEGDPAALARLYGTVNFRFSFRDSDSTLSTTVTFDPSGLTTLDSGLEILAATDVGPHEAFACRTNADGVSYFCIGLFEDGTVSNFVFGLDAAGSGTGRFSICPPEFTREECGASIEGEGAGPLAVTVTPGGDGRAPDGSSFPAAFRQAGGGGTSEAALELARLAGWR